MSRITGTPLTIILYATPILVGLGAAWQVIVTPQVTTPPAAMSPQIRQAIIREAEVHCHAQLGSTTFSTVSSATELARIDVCLRA
jgi:hypothetical protein